MGSDIHSVLRDHLERGALMDGLVLGEASVARASQTSRMPGSIALKLLHKEGLISDFEGRGNLVCAASVASELLKMFAEHRQIYDDLLDGHPESAATALKAHLRRALRPNLELLARLEPLADAHRPPYLVPAR